MHRCFVVLIAAATCAFAQGHPNADGKALFEKNCVVCHRAGAENRAPLPDALAQLSQQAIVAALETGAMKSQGASLTPAQRAAIARYLSKDSGVRASAIQNVCRDSGKIESIKGWNGWGADLVNSRYQPASAAGITAADLPKLKLAWAFGLPDTLTVFGQPTIAGGRLFFGSADGTVYSLDAHSGCMYWAFKAPSTVRSPISLGRLGDGYAAYFGDGQANVYAVDAQTGDLIWKVKVEDHKLAGITGGPALYDGKLYVPVRSGSEEMMAGNPKYSCCTFRGSLVALDAASGKKLWKTFTIPDPPTTTRKNKLGVDLYGPSGAAIWSAPTIDVKRKVIYVGTGNNYSDPVTKYSDAVLAFDMETGSLRWATQLSPDVWNFSCSMPDKASCPEKPNGDTDVGTSPILRTLPNGHNIIVVGQKSGIVHALDPEKRGAIMWQNRIGKGSALGGVLWGLAADNDVVYAPLSDVLVPGGGGGLFALRVANGEKVWYAAPADPDCRNKKKGCSPAQMAPATLIQGAVFSGSMDGHLRAYDTADGKVIWDFDTLRDFDTVNGVKAHGGSLNATGPTFADGMMFVNSGYAQLTGMPGNVMLAFVK